MLLVLRMMELLHLLLKSLMTRVTISLHLLLYRVEMKMMTSLHLLWPLPYWWRGCLSTAFAVVDTGHEDDLTSFSAVLPTVRAGDETYDPTVIAVVDQRYSRKSLGLNNFWSLLPVSVSTSSNLSVSKRLSLNNPDNWKSQRVSVSTTLIFHSLKRSQSQQPFSV